jgi:SpoVK/Ycf46/Vps4 family AAA+-type ATPase
MKTMYRLPKRWEDFVGLDPHVEHMKTILRKFRIEREPKDLSTFLYGPPGTGKSALARKLGQAFLCPNLDPVTLNPCNVCSKCKELLYLEGNDSIQLRLAEDADFFFSPLECSRLTMAELRESLGSLQAAPSIFRIVHLEEAGCLGENTKDFACLVPMDDRGFLWIATGMSISGLSPAFLRRFPKKLPMPLPKRDKLAFWLAKECKDRGIRCGSFDILQRLADDAQLRAGYALQVLNLAEAMIQPEITMEMVEEHIFDFDDV